MPVAVKSSPNIRRRCRTRRGDRLPPVILLGGNDNALSLARSFGRRGIDVYVLNKPHADVARSRFSRAVPLETGLPFEEAAVRWLCGAESDSLTGSVLLAASDEGLSILADHRDQLKQRFLLDLCNPTAQRQMLDKAATYSVAVEAGVATPKFWNVRTLTEVESLQQELLYPMLIKPRLSHLFQKKFSSKFLLAQSFSEVHAAFREMESAGIDVLLVEQIPGPDSALCSYYTWLDEDGHATFDFTKRIIRRHPTNMGLATYHVTDHVPGIKEPAVRLFRQAGLLGLANAEFKLDPRDGVMKLIECNARFTAANGLALRAGLDLGALVYNRLTGLPAPPMNDFRIGLTLWDPWRDWKAYRELRRSGQLSLIGWLRSVCRRHSFPSFDWTDPMPSLTRISRHLRKL